MLRNRGTVHLDKQFIADRAVFVYGPCDNLFARAGFPTNQDGNLSIPNDTGDYVEDLLNCRAVTDDATKIRHVYQGIDVAREPKGKIVEEMPRRVLTKIIWHLVNVNKEH